MKMRDSDTFQNLVDVACLQQEPPLQSACQSLSENYCRPIVFGALCSMPWLHSMIAIMRLIPIYIASCKSADSKKGEALRFQSVTVGASSETATREH